MRVSPVGKGPSPVAQVITQRGALQGCAYFPSRSSLSFAAFDSVFLTWLLPPCHT